MNGMATLQTEGLDLGPLINTTAAQAQAELLEWHSVAAGNMPDADITVLLWVLLADDDTLWESGWWDGEDWRLAESGGVCSGTVTHWSEPEGPTQTTPAVHTLAAQVAQLDGQRGAMAGLMRELLSVVQTIEPDDGEEALHLWALKDKAAAMLLALDEG